MNDERDDTSRRPVATSTASGPGWWVQCARCGHSRLVTRPQIMDGSWLKQPCPVCQPGTDPREAA